MCMFFWSTGWLSGQTEESSDCHCTVVVQSSVQNTQVVRTRKIKGSCVHNQLTTGMRDLIILLPRWHLNLFLMFFTVWRSWSNTYPENRCQGIWAARWTWNTINGCPIAWTTWRTVINMEVRLCPTTYAIRIARKRKPGRSPKYVYILNTRIHLIYLFVNDYRVHMYNLLFFINYYTFFQTNNLLKENNVVNEESAVVHDNLLSGWTCNTTNSKGRCNNIKKLTLFLLFCYIFVSC